jgi:hypothetical protein
MIDEKPGNRVRPYEGVSIVSNKWKIPLDSVG